MGRGATEEGGKCVSFVVTEGPEGKEEVEGCDS